MPKTVVDLPNLVITSSGSTVTNYVTLLDDADTVTLFLASSAAAVNPIVQITNQTTIASTATGGIFYNLAVSGSSGAPLVVVSTAGAAVISVVGFRMLRLLTSGGETSGQTVAYATKQISV